MLAETAVNVVILAVDVGGNHAAEGDELRAGGDGHEPSLPQKDAIELRTTITPASARNRPETGSKLSSRSASVVVTTGQSAPAGSDESPYERPKPRESVAFSLIAASCSDFHSNPSTTG